MKIRALLLAVICVFCNATMAQAETDDPVTLVERITGQIFADVTENFDAYSADHQALKTLVRTDLMPLLDIKYAARLILGRAGRGIEQEKIDQFADLMSTMLINRYSSSLLYFNSEVKLRVLPQRGELNEKITRVRTRVMTPKGGEAPIDYAFHKTTEGWKAFDVIVEGISYVTTYRNQIMPDVKANGIDSVIERLSKGQLELNE